MDIIDLDSEFIDLDGAEATSDEIIYEWDAKILKKLSAFALVDNENLLGDLMKEYIQSLQEITRRFDNSETLKKKITCHVSFLYSYCMELQCWVSETYLHYMEEIMTLYCNLEMEIIRLLKKKSHKYESRVQGVARRIIYMLTMYLFERQDHILHVLIKMNTSTVSQSCSDVLNLLYRHFLLNVPKINQSDESFCRNYIVFQKWKQIKKMEDWEGMDMIVYNMFKRSLDSIKNNKTLRKILMPESQSTVDIVLKFLRPFGDMSGAYFKHMKEKKCLEVGDLDFNIDLEEDEPSLPIDDESDEDVKFMEAFYEEERNMSTLTHKKLNEADFDFCRKYKQELDDDDDVVYVGRVSPPMPQVPCIVVDEKSDKIDDMLPTVESEKERIVNLIPALANVANDKISEMENLNGITRKHVQATLEKSSKETSENVTTSSKTSETEMLLDKTSEIVVTQTPPPPPASSKINEHELKTSTDKTSEIVMTEIPPASSKTKEPVMETSTHKTSEIVVTETQPAAASSKTSEHEMQTSMDKTSEVVVTETQPAAAPSKTSEHEMRTSMDKTSEIVVTETQPAAAPSKTSEHEMQTSMDKTSDIVVTDSPPLAPSVTVLKTNEREVQTSTNGTTEISVASKTNEYQVQSSMKEISEIVATAIPQQSSITNECAVQTSTDETSKIVTSSSTTDEQVVLENDAICRKPVEMRNVEVQANHVYNDYGLTTPPFEVQTDEQISHRVYANIDVVTSKSVEVQVKPPPPLPPSDYDDFGLTPPTDDVETHVENDPEEVDLEIVSNQVVEAHSSTDRHQIDTGQNTILNTTPNIDPEMTFNGNTLKRTNGQTKNQPKIMYTSTQKIQCTPLDDFLRFESAMQKNWEKISHHQDLEDVFTKPVAKIMSSRDTDLELFAPETNGGSRSNSPTEMTSPAYEGIDDFRHYYTGSVQNQMEKPPTTTKKKKRVRFGDEIGETTSQRSKAEEEFDKLVAQDNQRRKDLEERLRPSTSCSSSNRLLKNGVRVSKGDFKDERLWQWKSKVVVERMSLIENAVTQNLKKCSTLRVDYDKSTKQLNTKDVVRYVTQPTLLLTFDLSARRRNTGKVKSNKCNARNGDCSCCKLAHEFDKLNCNVPQVLNLSRETVPVNPESEFSNSPTFLPDKMVEKCLEETARDDSNFFKPETSKVESGKQSMQLPTAVPETFDFEPTFKNEVFSKIDFSNLDLDFDCEIKLPLKKRKLSKENVTEETKKEEISYPATPMISIAEVEALHPRKLQVNGVRSFKTPAERKEMPPLPPVLYEVESEPSPIITDQFNINNHTYNNPTINYHMSNVPVPFINIPCGSYYSLPPILVPFNNVSGFEQSKMNQQQETYVKKETRKQARQRRRR